MNTEAIGGYLELELPREGTEFHRGALRFQSSRAAFLALLRTCRPTAVWMPWYICESMVEPVMMAGIPIKRYEIDERLRIKSAEPADGEWLLYVNYFGISGNNVEDVLDRFPRTRVVIDNAQAFFAFIPRANLSACRMAVTWLRITQYPRPRRPIAPRSNAFRICCNASMRMRKPAMPPTPQPKRA
jgi:hypothetical protein